MKLAFRGVDCELPARPVVMGIVNLVADSFSGDGVTEIEAALALARKHLAAGAEIIDIGAESARTNRAAIPEEEEAAQLRRFVERWPELRASHASDKPWPLLSINAWRPGVIRAILPQGGDLLNDISGLPADDNARICADTGAALLIMHTVGQPKVAHTHVHTTTSWRGWRSSSTRRSASRCVREWHARPSCSIPELILPSSARTTCASTGSWIVCGDSTAPFSRSLRAKQLLGDVRHWTTCGA